MRRCLIDGMPTPKPWGFGIEFDVIGYSGWMTVEGSRDLSLEEKSKRLDLIIAGK